MLRFPSSRVIFSAIPKSRSSEDNVMGVSFTPQGARGHAQLISLFFAKDNPKDILAKGVVILLFAGVRSYSLGTAYPSPSYAAAA